DQRLDGIEAERHPVPVPGGDGLLVAAERVAQVLEDAQVVERVDVAGDNVHDRAHVGAGERGRRQQRRLGMDLLQVYEDGRRLDQHFVVRFVRVTEQDQGRYQALRVDGAVGACVLLAAAPGQVDGHQF